MQPIGIFDSGIGGLSIYKDVKKLLPQEDFIYVADKKYFPYGIQNTSTIKERGRNIVSWLEDQGTKLIVIACNTSTVSALTYLRKINPDIPIVGTVPVIKTCAEETKNGKIGVLSTPKTAASKYHKNLINDFADDKDVYTIAVPNLVEIIEEGKFHARTLELVTPLKILQKKEVDTLALACTHFPLLSDTIKDVVGEEILVLDSGEAIARQVMRVLEANEQLKSGDKPGETLFYTTKDNKNFDEMLKKYLNEEYRSKLINI
ncbi:MAG: glutamate racemase [Candidatus Spechtbacterales bacterium]|nr:glutamate racemase [Candidatus Spechtbacterales bacterium]